MYDSTTRASLDVFTTMTSTMDDSFIYMKPPTIALKITTARKMLEDAREANLEKCGRDFAATCASLLTCLRGLQTGLLVSERNMSGTLTEVAAIVESHSLTPPVQQALGGTTTRRTIINKPS